MRFLFLTCWWFWVCLKICKLNFAKVLHVIQSVPIPPESQTEIRDYRERHRGGKPWAGESRADTFIMWFRAATANKKKTKQLFLKYRGRSSRDQQGSTGMVLCSRWVSSYSLCRQMSIDFEHLRHVQGFVKCYRSDSISHISFSHRYLKGKLMHRSDVCGCLTDGSAGSLLKLRISFNTPICP